MAESPDPTAVRVALWRAMHVEIDPQPHVLADDTTTSLSPHVRRSCGANS